jgi:hypothetical protein
MPVEREPETPLILEQDSLVDPNLSQIPFISSQHVNFEFALTLMLSSIFFFQKHS